MGSQIQAIIRLAVALYAFFLFSESFRRRREIERFYQISLINAGMGLWNFSLFLYYSLDSPEAVYTVSQWGFINVTLTIFGFFFFAWRLAFGRKHDRLLPFFAVIPAVTCLLSATAAFQNCFIAGNAGFTCMPLRELVILHGPWFAIHSISGYLLSSIAVVLLVIQCFKPHIKNRHILLLLVVSILSFFAVLFLSNFTRFKGVVQPYAFLAHIFCISVFYWATFLDEDDSVIYFGKYRFYDTIGMPVLMFNVTHELVELNEDAKRYFDDIRFPVKKYIPYERFLGGSFFSRIDINSESGDDLSFFVQNVLSGQIIYFQKRDIVNNRQKRIGFSITLYNLRTVDAFIQKLEMRAYTDSLCQCFNRTCYEQRKCEILKTAPRPLSLLVADVDDLKSVNDRYGHRVGDEYIALCCEILRRASRSTDTLFRIGGDEFALFLSGTDEEGVLRIRSAVDAEFAAQRKDYLCGLSIGYSVVGEGDFDLEKHFALADAAMYQQKQGKKDVGRM
jgi:diguanylate cyclase (GGDEF)-like protein